MLVNKFIETCKDLVIEYYDELSDEKLNEEDVWLLNLNSSFGNYQAFLITSIPDDSLYIVSYEYGTANYTLNVFKQCDTKRFEDL